MTLFQENAKTKSLHFCLTAFMPATSLPPSMLLLRRVKRSLRTRLAMPCANQNRFPRGWIQFTISLR